MGVAFNDYPHIFSPVKIGPVELKNRIVFSPAVSAHASLIEGEVTDGLVEFVGAQARSGVGMVTIGASPVDFDHGRDFIGCLSIRRDEDIFPLKRLTDEIHRYGAKASCEMIHAGRIARNPTGDPNWANWVPSITEDIEREMSIRGNKFVEINKEQMEEVKLHFAQAAMRLKAANFDCCMIHGAHGNLVSAFLSPRFNQRTDEYGGSLENRMRFPLEVAKAVREAVGPDFGIEYRISSYEYAENSPTVDDVAAFLMKAQEYIDVVNLSAGLICDLEKVAFMMPGYPIDRCLNVERTAYIRSKLDIPVIAVGNIPDIPTAEKILAEGKADIIAMARNILADMDYVNKAYRNEVDDIRTCLHCNLCVTTPGMGGPVRCAVNPQAGRELKYRDIAPAPVAKKVMIVGGGIAGLQAAQIARKRGHEVVLYEKADRLGGRMHEASAMWCKDYFRKYLDWDIRKVEESGATIKLGKAATPADVEAEAPDALIIAIGAEHIKPPIPGLDGPNVIDITQADLRQVPIGKRVVFCGAGASSTEAAIDLARDGHDVTMLDMLAPQQLLRDLAIEIASALRMHMRDLDVGLIGQAKVTQVGEGFVEYETADGAIERIEADTVVSSFGLKPDLAAVAELQGIVRDTYVVGDARQARNIFWANRDAFDVAVEL